MNKRIMRRVFVALMLAVGVPAWSADAPPASPPTPPAPGEIMQIVRGLGAESVQEQEAAQKKAEGFGADAIARLRAAMSQVEDIRARQRIDKAIEALEDKIALAPTLVTADFEAAGPMQVVAALEKALGEKIEVTPPLEQLADNRLSVTLKLDKVPFWQAVAMINEQMPLRAAEGAHMDALCLKIGESEKGMVRWLRASGPLTFRLRHISRANTYRLEAERDGLTSVFYVNMAVMADPKLSISRSRGKVVVTEAADNKGNSMLSEDVPAFIHSPNGLSWDQQVNLRYPEGAGDRIATLAGTVKLMVNLKTSVLEINDWANPKPESQNLLGMNVTAQVIRQQDDLMMVKIKFERNVMDEQTFASLLDAEQGSLKVTLVDAQGVQRRHSICSTGGTKDQKTHDFNFNLGPRGGALGSKKFVPVKLRIEAPARTREIEVPFEFKDVPMP